jgi:hypothetical protein
MYVGLLAFLDDRDWDRLHAVARAITERVRASITRSRAPATELAER